MDSKIKFIDLFAGIGGMRLGFEQANAKCVLTCEINDKALTTYKRNFLDDDNHHYFKDILDLKNESLLPDYDILLAGFPCQPYSIAGLRNGLKDERGGKIFKAILKILETSKPKAFLLENVKGLLSHNNKKTYLYLKASLKEIGYEVDEDILNTMTHANCPQNRERLFIVGFKEKKHLEKFEFPKKEPLLTSIGKCLEKRKVEDHYYYSDRYKCFDVIKKNVVLKNTFYQYRRVFVRELMTKVCPTLTANMGSGGHNVPLILDKHGIRKITPREAANFQGFPDDYYLPAELSDSTLYHQIGNSVSIPLINKIALEMIKALQTK